MVGILAGGHTKVNGVCCISGRMKGFWQIGKIGGGVNMELGIRIGIAGLGTYGLICAKDRGGNGRLVSYAHGWP